MASLTFIGTATTLLRLGPFTVLTDPNFLHRGQLAYLGKGLVSRRLTEPALRPQDLPPLDAIVLSHLHGDHWDRVARRELDSSTKVLTTRQAAARLRRRAGFRNSSGLAVWETATLHKDGCILRVTAVPGRHARGPVRALLPPVNGHVLDLHGADGVRALRLYLTGDTLVHDQLPAITEARPDIDVCVLHLGGTTLPGGLVVTMDAAQGARFVEVVRPRRVVPVHYDDYGVFKSPLAHFRDEMERRGLSGQVDYVARGDTVALPLRGVEPSATVAPSADVVPASQEPGPDRP